MSVINDIKRALFGRSFLIAFGGMVICLLIGAFSDALSVFRMEEVRVMYGYHRELLLNALGSDIILFAVPILAAMDSVYEYLFTPYGLMLNAPCYTKVDEGIGFVTRVYPGLKENGAIFSHPNPWAWVAEARLGRGGRAMELYNALCPALQNDKIEVRQSEPYSYCQFVVGRDHTAFGRARHPFMTGSSGWAYYAATQYLLGVRPDFDVLRIDPCVPADWKEFSVTRVWRSARYEIHVLNPKGVEKGVRSIRMDGREVDALPVLPAGQVCHVEVLMGKPKSL